jgi:hypothetical protein
VAGAGSMGADASSNPLPHVPPVAAAVRGDWIQYENASFHFEAMSQRGSLIVCAFRGGDRAAVLLQREELIRIKPELPQLAADLLEENDAKLRDCKSWKSSSSHLSGTPPVPPPKKRSIWTAIGFQRFTTTPMVSFDVVGETREGIVVPYWSLFTLLALTPFIWLATHRRTSRQSGLCRRCGYDLTGNTSGTCPECGTKIVGKA